jgi:recombination protein RecT
VKKAIYIPMVAGLLKKIRNSSELQSITAQIVFENDQFEYRLGDDEKFHHVPLIKGPRGKPIAAYSIAKTKDGGIYRELMLAEEIEVTRNFSKAKDNGPWAGPFFLEMWKKTVLRRLSKRLPMSTDLNDRYDVDDQTTDVTPPGTQSEAVRQLRKSLVDYCQRNGGGSPHGILRDLVGHDSFDDLTDQEAERAHRDFESRYLGVEATMD